MNDNRVPMTTAREEMYSDFVEDNELYRHTKLFLKIVKLSPTQIEKAICYFDQLIENQDIPRPWLGSRH